MWGREGGEEEKVQKHIYLHPFTYEGQLYIYIRRVTYFFGGLFLIGWKDFFLFLEYRRISGRAWIEEIQKRRGRGREFQLAWVDKSLDNINVLSVFLYFLVPFSFSSPLSSFFLIYAFQSPFCSDDIHNTIHIICSDSCGTLHIWYAY